MTSCPCAVDDPSCEDGVTDIDELGCRKAVSESSQVSKYRSVCAHAQADEAEVERQLYNLALRSLDDEGVRTYFLKSGSCQLMDAVLLHACVCARLGGCIKSIADEGHHLDDGDVSALRCKEFDNVETDFFSIFSIRSKTV